MKKIFLALVMLLSFGSTLWIEKASAAKVVFYNIRTADDWMKFRQEVEKAKGQYWIDARLEADITTGGGIGLNADTPYRGTFDGNGHTMTVDINRDDGKPCALFCYVGDVTIRDLHLKGNIKGGIHSAGLIGYAIDGSSAITLDRVWVSTDVSTNDSYVGGIIGHSNKANVYMNDCRFDGSLKTNGKESASYAGSIVGWCNGGGWTFHRICDQSNFKNTYYKLFCIDHNASTGSWYAWWGNGKSSALVTHHGWTSMTYYNKSDQSEVVNIMNAEKAGSWRLFEGKAVPRMNKSAAVGSWNKLSGGATDGYVLQSGRYYVTEDISFTNNSVGGNGLTIADGATVHIYLCNAKLTATGGKASGRTGAGAGIYLPQGSTLYIEGRGSVKAKGGNAANGSNGSSGGSASADDSNCNWIRPGDGGAGGDGGGGAGAGIGTSGGNGGVGGSSVGRGTIYSFAATCFSGIEGNKGGDGETAKAMGNLFVASVISVSAEGGQAGTYNGSAGGGGSYHLHRSTTWDHTVGGGSGGGGGGFGGSAEKIGTGGPGGGGGGSGSSGTTCYGSKWKSGWFSAGSKGGKGGQDGDGGWASNAGDAVYNGERGWDSGDNRASGGDGGNHGKYSEEQRTRFDYAIQFNVYDKNGALDKSNTVTYKSNQNSANATVSIPSAYALGLTKSDKYLSSWYENQNRTGTARIALDEISIGQGTKNLYAEWKLYENLFADGHGTKSDPFIIREDQLIDLAEYVNGGGNTRNVYFKQDGNIQVPDILKNRNKGSQWTPIGKTLFFEGDYDGGGYLIRKATIDTNNADVVGIFGKVTGSIHNLGVEECTFKTTKDDSRGGAIAGLLLEYETDQRITGQMRDCYSANNNITATYAGGLVGEMNHSAKMTHSLDIQNNLYGGNIGGLASQIDNSCQVDLCFSDGELCNNGYSQETNSVANIDSDRLKSGEITWLLNDKTAFGVAWYQNLTGQSPVNAYPVLNKECNRVFFYNDQYTNNPGGTFFAFSGQGLKDNPFLINNKADLDKLADYCNKGNNSNAIYFLQTADIDLNGGGLTPVATSLGFGGVYDGGGHIIRNGNIAIDGIAGIFGVVSGTVTRLCVENTTVKYTKKGMRAGGIAARITGNGEISNCLVKDCKIENNGLSGVVGGIAADMFDQGVIKNCLVINTSLSASRTGSICSDTKSGNVISRCYTDGDHITSSDSYADVQNSLPKVSTESLKSGEICHKLNGGINNPDPKWFQNISGSKLDNVPVLSEDHAIVTKNERGHYTNDIFNLSRLGKGTKDDPYKIATPKDLQDLVLGIGTMKRSNFYIRQTADIDLKDSLFLPIGTCLESFEGYYDGDGHVIKNLEIIGTNRDIKEYLGESVGLFNAISGVVENLGLENCKLTAARVTKRVGGLAGRLTGHGQLRNCFVKNSTIDCNSFEGCVVGALVGEQADTTVIETSYGFQNTIVGMNDGGKQYGYIVGHMGGNAKASQLYTDGPAFCAEWQKGEKNIANSETNVSEFRFNSGDICWLLSGSKNDNTLWRQTMLTDNTPVPDTNHKLVYRHELNDQVMYTNSTEWPYTVWMTLDPNHSDQQAKGIEVFKADKNWVVPSFKFANYAANRVDFEFKGWNTQADGRGTFYPADYEMLPEQDDRFYAMWDMLIPIDANPVPVVILPEDTIYFKVYDHGGSKNAYGYDYKGKLTLRAPDEDHVIVLSGTIATEALGSDGKPHDYLVVYDGSASSKDRLTNDHAKSGDDFEDVFFSTTEGEKESIGSLTSSEDYMTLEFITDDEKNFDGLDLMVTVLPKDIGPIGQSTETEPYEVATLEDLQDVDQYIRLTGNSKVYLKQTADIDLNGKAFTPLASSVSSFEGYYDGGGHVIRNGKISAPTFAGVFGVVSGTVTRLGVENMTINYEKVDGRSGGIAARLTGNGVISNCFVKGCTVTNNGIQGYYGQGVAGAIVSDMFDQAVIKNCFTLNNKVSATRAAHICSDTKSGTEISRCYTDGNYLFRESGATITDSKPNMTAKQFSSGEVCYLLNGEKTENVVWRQTLGTDNIPVLTDGHGVVFGNLVNDKVVYSNTFATPKYYISNKEEFSTYISKKADIYLTQDIDLGEWNTLKTVAGNFDGGGHTIKFSSNDFRGFISTINQGASVKHLRVEANAVTSKWTCAGIAGSNLGTISDCHFHGNIHSTNISGAAISSISAYVNNGGIIDHCSASGRLTAMAKDGKVYPITQDVDCATNCTWVDPDDQTQYAAQKEIALSAQAEYPVYAKGILDATRPKIILGYDTIVVDNNHLASLTIKDGERFKCPAEVTVDQITYKRRGTNGAYEPWVLPFDYTIDADMLTGGVEFYRFEKDSVGNIETKQINSGETYQAAANEPMAIKSTKADEIDFKMKLVKDGKLQPMIIQMPLDGVAASMASTKDIAKVIATYDSISADKTVKELMYIWDNDQDDFVLSDSVKGVTPFRYYLQYIEKSTGNLEKYEDTDWGRSQTAAADSTSQQAAAKRLVARRAPLSTLTAEGWQPIFLDLFGSQEVTAEMLEDYDILGLWDLYDQKAGNNQYAVSVIYVPVPAGFELPYAAPLLVRAKHADAKPLVTEQMAREIDALLTEMAEQNSEEEVEAVFNELHYWCATFNGRYDVWQFALPEKDDLLNEYGALAFAENGGDKFFNRVPASDNATMTPMSYCFTAYDARTFENLPLANDRIEIVVMDLPAEVLGIEDVRGKMDDVKGKRNAVYNLNGQKVGDSYRGIVIKNGRKIFNK